MDKELFKAWLCGFLFVIILVIAGAIVTVARMARADTSSDLQRCEPYRERVQNILQSEGVGRDFYYLMVAESRCTDRAISPKGAAGFWQLMPSTAIHYGCFDVHDLECSTRAAARYIKHLGQSFHRFDDIIVAYNMGGHNYRRNGASGQALGLLRKVKWLMLEGKR